MIGTIGLGLAVCRRFYFIQTCWHDGWMMKFIIYVGLLPRLTGISAVAEWQVEKAGTAR